VNVKQVLLVLLFVVILAGATGGDASARLVGDALGRTVHWVGIAWDSLVQSK
jgi:hypothetical protein